MTDFYNWSQTAADNATADEDINWAEFQNPDTVNDSARALMARIAEWRADLAPTRSSAGSGNAYTVTSAAGGSGSYRDGEMVAFIADRANTAACTLNVNARGAVNFRPVVGTDFSAGEIRASQPIIAYYRSASNEWLAIGSGYHVNAMTSGLLTQSVAGRLIKIGTPVLSLAPTPNTGYIRLTEATQSILKTNWPELNTYLSGLSYPWGSTSTHFSLPPAAGYMLRFAATSSSIDPDGPRTAGSTQTDTVKAHNHAAGTLAGAATLPDHVHQYSTPSGADNFLAGSGGTARTGSTTQNTGNPTSNPAINSTISGSTANNSSDTETRGKNVAFHVDIFASSALSSGTLGMFGFAFAWDTGTSAADPGTARVRGNNATLASITALYINETDAWGVNIGGVLGNIDAGSVLRVSKIGAQANTIVFNVSGAVTDNGSYRTIPVTVLASNGSLSNSDTIAFELAGGVGATGDAGATGPTGPNTGLDFAWNDATSGDPGSGKVLANNATLASATAINISKTGRNSESLGAVLATWDDSTSTHKGHLRIFTVADRTEYIEAEVSGITDNSTYYTVAISVTAANGTPTADDIMAVMFERTGNVGATGDAGSNGTDGANPGLTYTFSTTTTDSDPGAGYLRANNADLSAATALYIDDADANANAVEAELLSWDDVTNATSKGKLVITTPVDGAAVVFDITGASTDATGYVKLAVTYSAGATSFANDAVISVQFAPAGNDGGGSGDMQAATYDPATIAEQLVGLTATQTLTNKTLTSPAINTPALGADSVDAITEIAAALKTGADGTLVTGTAGTNGNLGMWNSDGDIVDSTVAAADVVVDSDIANMLETTDIGVSVQGYDADTLKADTADVLTAGFAATSYNAGTQSGAGTYTPDEANGNMQHAVNGGAHTLAPPTNSCTLVIQYTNDGSAGTITTSGFTQVTGDSLTTVNGDDFLLFIVKHGTFSLLNVVALQ